MFETLPNEAKLQVLLKVVRSLIVNSPNAEIFRLEEILKEKFPNSSPNSLSEEERKEAIKKEVKEKIREQVKSKLEPKEESKTISFAQPKENFPVVAMQRPVNFKVRRVLKVPRVNFPAHLSSIRPAPTNKVSVDLGKLNPYVSDPKVKTIETEGESEIVYVSGAMGRKPTNLKLSKIEIDEIINRFSKAAKIPKKEGMFKVAVGKLLLTAMISESVSPRFIIEKMS